MAQTADQRRASRAVQVWLTRHERNATWLARQTKADPGTIGDFLNGNRWPKFATQGKIEKALGWPPGTLIEITDGGYAPEDRAAIAAAEARKAEALIVGFVIEPQRELGLPSDEVERITRQVKEYAELQVTAARAKLGITPKRETMDRQDRAGTESQDTDDWEPR